MSLGITKARGRGRAERAEDPDWQRAKELINKLGAKDTKVMERALMGDTMSDSKSETSDTASDLPKAEGEDEDEDGAKALERLLKSTGVKADVDEMTEHVTKIGNRTDRSGEHDENSEKDQEDEHDDEDSEEEDDEESNDEDSEEEDRTRNQ